MRTHLWLLSLLAAGLCGAPLAFADVTVIYRKSDNAVVGWVKPPHSVQKEIDNITTSELGGAKEDYATTSVPEAAWARHESQVITINRAGQAVFAPDPKVESKKGARRSGRKKLKDLGLTQDEVDAILSD